MKTKTVLAATLLGALVIGCAIAAQEKKEKPMVIKMTPVLFVNEIEPILPFWIDRLGFQKTVEVPEGGKLGFVMLNKGNIELMYQTWASLEKDMPASTGPLHKGPTFLYLEVADLDATLAVMNAVRLAQPVRTTFYGTKESSVQDPGLHFITFAQRVAGPQH